MKAQKKEPSQSARRMRAKKRATRAMSGDQNSVSGRVDSGGIVIQSGQHHIEITQHFGGPTASVTEQNKLRSLKISTEYFEPETIYIAEGPFWMGSPVGEGIPEYETPQHEVYLPPYRIGKYPVTNAQYEIFIHETERLATPNIGWKAQRVAEGFENYPVIGITWFESLAYCQWLSEKTGRSYSLPNEAEWEKACRGENTSIYPWGNEFDPGRCNHGRDRVAPVDAYPAQNEYECFDFVGNVRQWTCGLWGEKWIAPDPKYAYPWKDDRRNDLNANRQIRRVVRGSSMSDHASLLRCSARNGQVPDDEGLPEARHSFRVVLKLSA